VRKTVRQQLPTSKFIDMVQLSKLKMKAIRAGVWFKALTRIDRVLIDLTMKVTQRVRSLSLTRSIMSVAAKLENLLEGKLARVIREFGFPLASELSILAQRWGNVDAEGWRSDFGFAQYLSVVKLNG
jgi:hypothetical protein